MTWLDTATSFVKQWEGCSLTAYPDPATGSDPWTVGYGATGPDITQGTVWTQDQADSDLAARLNALGDKIDACVTVGITDSQKAALCSFSYNLGIGALEGSTLLRLLNSGDTAGAAGQFPLWDKAAGKVMQGLLNRRLAEQALFNS